MRTVDVSNDGAIAWIRLQRPERANALSAELVEDLLEAVGGAIESRARVLVLSGAGRSFCGGFDLEGLDQETDGSLAYRFLRIERLLQTLYYAPLYTVALSHGAVSGAGADLVAACGKRIAAPGTSFRFPGIRFGVVLGTNRLLDLVGNRARSLILEQEMVDAAEAQRINLIDQVAEPSEWQSLIEASCRSVEKVSAAAVREVMQLDEQAGNRDLGILARSVSEPGLKERIRAYWGAAKAVAGKAAAKS
jgi:enoyl-CoA hydratase/carnithine racemase